MGKKVEESKNDETGGARALRAKNKRFHRENGHFLTPKIT